VSQESNTEWLNSTLPDIDNATKLLVKHIDDDGANIDPSKIQELVKGVGCLPLAIVQVAAFMDDARIMLEEMLTILKSKRKIDVCIPLHVLIHLKTDLMTKVIHWENSLLRYQETSIAYTFLRQLQNLEQQFLAVTNLLKTMTFLNTECILIKLFRMGAAALTASSPHIVATVDAPVSQNNHSLIYRIENQTAPFRTRRNSNWCLGFKSVIHPKMTSILDLIQSPTRFNDALSQLQNQSLIQRRRDTVNPSIWMHNLIQLLVIRYAKKNGGVIAWFENAAELTCRAFEDIRDPSEPQYWQRCEIFVPHIQLLTVPEGASNKL
jgi:hypothetical protein